MFKSSLKCVVRAYFTHVSFFIYTKQKTRLPSHIYKIHPRKTHACNEPRIDESSFFFAQRYFVLFRSLFFSSSFPSRFFLYSEINFPSSSTDALVAVISFFSHSFFLRFQLVWTLMLAEHDEEEEEKRRKFSSVNKYYFFMISIFTEICFNKNYQNI